MPTSTLAAFEFAELLPLGLIAVGAALGSVVRDLVVTQARVRCHRGDLGILLVNLLACAVVGTMPFWSQGNDELFKKVCVLGFAGGLSTWSGLAVEVALAARKRKWGLVTLHLVGALAVALGILAAAGALRSAQERGTESASAAVQAEGHA